MIALNNDSEISPTFTDFTEGVKNAKFGLWGHAGFETKQHSGHPKQT